MPSTLIKGKYIICGVNHLDDVDIMLDGAVFQQDGEIVDIGKYSNLKGRYNADEEIGSDEHVVLPGLVNAHQHGRGVPYLSRGVLDDNLEVWLTRLIGGPSIDSYLDTLYCAARMVESGVTTIMHSHFPRSLMYEEEVNEVLKAYQEVGIRVAFALGIRNQNQLVYEENEKFLRSLPAELRTECQKYLSNTALPEEEYFALFEKLLKRHNGAKVKILHGPLGIQWCSDDLLLKIKTSANRKGTGIHTHFLETMYQKAYSYRKYGKSLVEHLLDIDFIGPELSFAHCVWLTEKDIELLGHAGASVCHNPSCNLRIKSGIAPINRMWRENINIALGTDSASMNDDEDIWQDLRLCAYIHRLPGLGKSILTPGQLLKMVTTNGAKVTGFSNLIGKIEKGKKADIVLVNLKNIREPYLDPMLGIMPMLLSRVKKSDVDIVMVDGKVILRSGRHTQINIDEIAMKLRESLERRLDSATLKRRQMVQDLLPYISKFYEGWQEYDPEQRAQR